MTTLLKDIREMEPHYLALKALGYETLEQFVSAARVSISQFSAHLKTDVVSLLENLPMPAGLTEDDYARFSTGDFPLGAAIDYITFPETAASISFRGEQLLESVNLIEEMPPLRDQGQRGTCVAHAALAVCEHFMLKLHSYREMSEQFLYWLCKKYDNDKKEGTTLQQAFTNLFLIGCCLEETWHYVPAPRTPDNWGQDPPPMAALNEAPSYKFPMDKLLLSHSVLDLKSELGKGRCVAFTIPAFKSWYGDPVTMKPNLEVMRTGNILMPPQGDPSVGGHAMCMVGYEDLLDHPELGYGRFLIRNSWGLRWGTESLLGVGYGTIPYAFITNYCVDAFTFDLEI
jgi:C1A family cysteine protease